MYKVKWEPVLQVWLIIFNILDIEYHFLIAEDWKL